jgi:hypothetical protein
MAVAKLRSTFTNAKQLSQAMLDKVAGSLLLPADCKRLHMQPHTADDVARKYAELPVHRAGFVIPYFDLKGRTTKFYRFRYLEYGTEFGFTALVQDDIKKLRYGQPAKTVNELYLPPFTNWADVAANAEQPVMITEGELKSACVTKHLMPCIGLGGVWCFKSNKQRMAVLPQFAEFQWSGRTVYICYDSDASSNPLVVQAENALARELLRLGATPHICRIPPSGDDKVGVDDYLVAHGTDNFTEQVLTAAEQWQQSEELFRLNEEVLYVADPGIVLRLDTLQRMAPRAFIDHAYATRVFYEEQVSGNSIKRIERSAAAEWIKWPHRAEVQRITYQPGQPRIVGGCLNVWKGWACQPVKGDIAPWHQLLDYLFTGCPVQDRQWFEQWLAYPLQHPGTKLYSAVVLWGIHQGTGKTLIGHTMFQIYGSNATEIGDRDLYSTHNEWAENKQFVMGDEITGGDKRNTADRMKSMITQRLLRLNPKYVPSYTVPDCINYYFTSNHPDAFFLEDTDRRFFIHEVKGQPLPDAFYKQFMRWLDADGHRHLFDYLLRLDCTAFDPQGHAPITASKMEMIDNGRSDLGSWVAKLREDTDRILQVAGKPVAYSLFTSEELKLLYDPQGQSRVTANGLARELRRAGFVKVYDGMGVLTQTSGRQRLWAIRNSDKLLRMTGPQLGKLYDTEHGGKDVENRKF